MKDYFSFSKRERNAFIALLVLVLAFLYLPELYPGKKTDPKITAELTGSIRKPAADTTSDDNNWQPIFEEVEDRVPARLFTFDPNTLDEAGFIMLGLPQRTARTIVNYRNKGGRFRSPEDLRKIYSLKKEDADRIIPYARVAAADYQTQKYTGYSSSYYPNSKKRVEPIDINTASQEDWKSLPGIGEVLSTRIMGYRERIGGFSSIDQVAKTWGLPDSTFRKILPLLKLASPATLQVNINTAFENELMECPGIDRDLAQAIIIYRRQHGKFQTVNDLRQIVFITDEMFRKILPCIKAD